MSSLHRIGLIVPSSNTTMETEVPSLLRARERERPQDEFTFHSARLRMQPEHRLGAPPERASRSASSSPGGSPTAAWSPPGSVSLGLGGEARAGLRVDLAATELPHRGRHQRVRPVEPTIVATVDFHGRSRGPVRDPVLRDVTPLV